jgi:hypothetical protein
MKIIQRCDAPCPRVESAGSVFLPKRFACFPYGGVRRIRFQGFQSGSCSNLTPAPGSLPNELAGERNRKTGLARAMFAHFRANVNKAG